MMKQLRWAWSLVLLFSAIMAGISAFALPGTFLCLVVILWFLLVCPGMTVVRYLNLKEPQAEWVLAIALSLAIDALVASIALYAGVWFPPGILWILMTFCIVGVIARFAVARPVPLTRTGHAGRKVGSLATVFLLLALVALVSGLGVWSYSMHMRATTPAVGASHQEPLPASPTVTSAGAPVVDTVIVMDNVNLITKYDPEGDRYRAAQLFASMLSLDSEVGIVRVTSNLDPVRMLTLQTLHTSGDRTVVMNTLTSTTFGPVDPTPVAYFTPALEMAGNMLRAKPAGDRKLIVIFTDALAFSGDQNACAGSPDAYHLWFCTVTVLAQQGITAALVGFTSPGNTSTLQPVQQFFAAHGGISVPVSDGPNLAAQLTMTYRTLLSATHRAGRSSHQDSGRTESWIILTNKSKRCFPCSFPGTKCEGPANQAAIKENNDQVVYTPSSIYDTDLIRSELYGMAIDGNQKKLMQLVDKHNLFGRCQRFNCAW